MTRVVRIIGIAVAGGLLVGGLTGCGGGAGAATSYADAETGQEAVRLRGILRENLPLPDGFSARPGEVWQSPFSGADRNCRAVLNSVTGRPPQRALQAKAAVSYQGDVLGELAAVGLASYSGSEAEWHQEDLGKALAACTAVSGGPGTEFTTADLAVPRMGDEAVGKQLRGRLNGYPYALDLVLVRTGDMVVTLVHTGLGKVDAERTRELASAVVGAAQ